MLVVAGLSLKNLKPRVWDSASPHYLPSLQAVMVSYADFHRNRSWRSQAMERGLHDYLGVPLGVRIFLDNGAFYFLSHEGETPREEYEEFVERARPDWWPIPQDYIPTPKMSLQDQKRCYTRTMAINHAYDHDGFTPIIHVGEFLQDYTVAFKSSATLSAKPGIALGGIVPNLLRAPKARPYQEILDSLKQIRSVFAGKQLHVFGIGGTATLHLAELLGVDSVDSSGWRNRAARGLVQLPGTGDRIVAELGSWRGRKASEEDWTRLRRCGCPPCQQDGPKGLAASGIEGASHRATHNLWVLLEEARLIEAHLAAGTYKEWYRQHLDNTIYLPLIERLIEQGECSPARQFAFAAP